MKTWKLIWKIAARFHALSVAAETLGDPEKRKAYDATLKATLIAKQRTKAMDAQRRAARDALIARESLGSSKSNKETLAHKWLAMEKLRDEERARMEALETHAQRTAELIAKSVREQTVDEEITHSKTPPSDVYALRVKWKHEVSQQDLESIFCAFGTLDRVLISSKGRKSALIMYSDVAVAVLTSLYLRAHND